MTARASGGSTAASQGARSRERSSGRRGRGRAGRGEPGSEEQREILRMAEHPGDQLAGQLALGRGEGGPDLQIRGCEETGWLPLGRSEPAGSLERLLPFAGGGEQPAVAGEGAAQGGGRAAGQGGPPGGAGRAGGRPGAAPPSRRRR